MKKLRNSVKVVSAEVTSPLATTKKIPLAILRRARYINRLFAGKKSLLCGKRRRFSENSREFGILVKLAFLLRSRQVNITDYLNSHFDCYGEFTYPSHLIAEHSWYFYLEYQKRRYAKMLRMNKEKYRQAKEECILFLAKRRSESLEQVRSRLGAYL